MRSGRDESGHTASVENDNPVDVAELETAQVRDSASLPRDARPRVAWVWTKDGYLPDVDGVGIFFPDHTAAFCGSAPTEAVLPAVQRPRSGVVSEFGKP
jgi:hypothetical protein